MRRPRLVLRAPIPPELEIHKACAALLDRLLLTPWTSTAVGHVELSGAQAARFSAVGVKRGWPDILIIFNGLIFGIEIKREGGKPSRTRIAYTRRGSPRILVGQEEQFAILRKAGMTIGIVTSTTELLAQLRVWGLPLRPHVVNQPSE
jgi:hypothetical protein